MIFGGKCMENKVYIVTSGEYSDYHVRAVFSTKKKANEYIQQYGTDCRIEEYDLDEEVVKKTQLWRVYFSLKDNSFCEAHSVDYNDCYYNKYIDTCKVYNSLFCGERIIFYVDADSMDRAVKIARERFAAVKANEYILFRLTRPYKLDKYGRNKFESFNVKTNEFIKE